MTYDGGHFFDRYEGFGELWGIPSLCFDEDTNEVADCGPTTRHVSAFSIPHDGNGFVTMADGSTKWVKWLDREVRFAADSSVTAAAQSITLGDETGLPAAPVLTGDANDPSDGGSAKYAGDYFPELFNKAPKVIHGEPQVAQTAGGATAATGADAGTGAGTTDAA